MAERTRTRLDPDVRREQILDAASALFRDQDYSAVSLESVAERAGVTRGLLHHYFGSKRALFLEVLERAVAIPDSVQLVPPDITGTPSEVIDVCVTNWMRMIRSAGGLWSDLAATGGLGGGDVDEVMTRARDTLVDRMVDELPFPATLDPELLRSALRCYAAFARVATDEWLVEGSLDTARTEALLGRTLLALITEVVPAMTDAAPAPESR